MVLSCGCGGGVGGCGDVVLSCGCGGGGLAQA